MKIVFLSHYFAPHVGGVETHIQNISKRLLHEGHSVSVICRNHDNLSSYSVIDGLSVYRFKYRNIKYLGIVAIWIALGRYVKQFSSADIIHIHDVAIWYAPFRLFIFWKPIYLTIHGWEGKWPIPYKNIILKKFATYISKSTILVGEYLKKYYGVAGERVIYGAIEPSDNKSSQKTPNLIVYKGRLEPDTGINVLLSFLASNKDYQVKFYGDGSLKRECKKYGRVYGYGNYTDCYRHAKYVFAGGYLSIIEALYSEAVVIAGSETPIRQDILTMTPFCKYIYIASCPEDLSDALGDKSGHLHKIQKGYNWASKQTWERVVRLYLDLWSFKKAN